MKRINVSYIIVGSFFIGVANTAFCANVILNEYNAVDSGEYLGGGTAAFDDAGGYASDSYFGRVVENGGDWFELVVITDHLDMRNWQLDIYEDGALDETLDLTDHSIWSDLRSGTIITIAEDVPSDISYNPAGGDWWIQVQANNDADGIYIEASNFAVSSSDWQLRIRDAGGVVIYGPAGEGVSPGSGIGGTEIFRLEDDPSAATVPSSAEYDDADSQSTFGAPNQWGVQNLNSLCAVTPPVSTLTLVTPNGSEVLKGGQIHPIAWSDTGTVDQVQIAFSVDDGLTWTPVYPSNIGNSGSYDWLVPVVDSETCRVRITNAANFGIVDTSDDAFIIYECLLDGDVTGDCIVNLDDLAEMAAVWLDCANPYDLSCAP